MAASQATVTPLSSISHADQDAHREPALVQFAAEEVKHIELFVRFRRAFTDDFRTPCGFIGPAEDIGAAIRAHSPLGLRSLRWTFLGSAMRNDGFLNCLGAASPAARARIEQAAPAFC